MTEQKNDSASLNDLRSANAFDQSVNLREKYQALSEVEQKMVVHFFNLHNAAGFCYDQMSQEAKDYTNYCIQLSQESQSSED